MTTSAYMPDVKVEIAFNAGYSTPAASRTWTDVSQWVELDERISITRGRSDQFSTTEPNTLTLTLDNTDGRFTAGRSASPYYPNVRLGRPVRVTSTPVGGSPSVRFLGFVDEWPTEWDGTDDYAKAQVTARSRMARLGFGAELVSSAIVNEIMSAAPSGPYFPLTDPADSMTATDLITGEVLDASPPSPFTDEPGLLDGETSGRFVTNVGDDNRTVLRNDALATKVASGAAIELFYKWRTVSVSDTYLAGISNHFGGSAFLWIDELGVLKGSYGGATGLAGGTVAADAWTHVRLACDSGVASLYVNGTLTDSFAMSPILAGEALFIGNLLQGGAIPNDVDIAHVAFGLPLAGLSDRAALRLGLPVESASDRIERYARWAGVPSSEYVGDAGTHNVTDIDTSGKTALDAMRVPEATEGGVLFDAASGELTFLGRAARYNTTAVLTLSASAQQIEAGLVPKLDRSALVNDATATAADGTTAHYFDRSSIDDYGYAKTQLEIASTNSDAYDAAAWRVNTYAEPQPRIPQLGIDMLPLVLADQTALLGMEIGDRIATTSLPTQAQASSLTYFVEGFTETIGPESYGFVLNVTPTLGFDVFVLDDATKGVLDGAYPIAW